MILSSFGEIHEFCNSRVELYVKTIQIELIRVSRGVFKYWAKEYVLCIGNPTSVGEMNETFIIRVWKSLSNRSVLKL